MKEHEQVAAEVSVQPASPAVEPVRRSSSLALRVADREASRVVQRAGGSSVPLIRRSSDLVVGAANDPYEREADRVAAEVVARLSGPGTVRRAASTAADPLAGAPVSDEIQRDIAGSTGRVLEPGMRASMEGAFGADLSSVRIHDSAKADVLSRSLQAKAFTVGSDIFFRSGEYDPSKSAGQELVAHELAHVVQTGDASMTARRFADGGVVRRDLDDRSTSWKDVDEEATKKRLAQAAKEYKASGGAGGTGGAFDQSLVASEEEVATADEQIARQKQLVQSENDLDRLPQVFWLVYKKNPELAVQEFGLTKTQQATLKARAAGKVGGMDNMGAFLKPKGDAGKEARDAAKAEIATPEDLFSKEEIAAHLGEFAKGAHTFIDIGSSKKILGWITDGRFHGWGAIKKDVAGGIEDRASNFVAPLDEANAANAKAHAADGIETLENDLGIPNKNWSNSDGNPGKELMRWVIPRPKLTIDEETAGVLLKMATGKEVGADPDLWVAGGFTKGGAREATIEAIPRDDLLTLLSAGEIKQKIERYPETGDGIPWGKNQAPVVGKKPGKGA